jgi:hypothetical protein
MLATEGRESGYVQTRSSDSQRVRPAGLGGDLAADAHTYVTGRRDDVDPMVRVAGVDEDQLVLLEPLVHRVPVEGGMAGERRSAADRLGVVPGGVLDGPVPETGTTRAP